MRFETNIYFNDVYKYISDAYPLYVFEPDTFLGLIEIEKLGDQMRDDPKVLNVLCFEDDGESINLMYKTTDAGMLAILKSARDMLDMLNNQRR